MTANTSIDPIEMLNRAKDSEYKEAYHTFGKTVNYRIGCSVRVCRPGPPHFFVEILLYLARNDDQIDFTHLTQTVSALKNLQARHYLMVFQDGNCISCEKKVLAERLQKECETDAALMKKTYSN